MSRNHYVYIITNLINNKKYVGKRSCSCSIEDDIYMGSGTLLKKAQTKYGIKNFKKEILEVCSSEKEAFEKEMYYIKIFNAKNNPNYYNLTDGGEGVSGYLETLSYEEKLEHLWKLRVAQTKRYSKETQEQKKIRCEKMVATRRAKAKKNLLMIDRETKEVINRFFNLQDASKYVGVHHANIGKARREGRTSGGFFWCYEEEYEERFGRR